MRAAELFKSLSEPIRLRILHLLSTTEPELCVCDLVAVLGAPQGTISRHLTQLRYAGLVSDRREGVWVYYRIAPQQSETHRAVLQCVKDCFTDDPVLAEDAKRYIRLKKARSLACCMPQNPQGRPVLPSKPHNLKVRR